MPEYYLVMLYLSDVAQRVFPSSSYYSRCILYVTDTCDNVNFVLFVYSLLKHTLIPFVYSIVYLWLVE